MPAVSLHQAAKKALGRIPKKDHGRILDQLAALEACNHPLEHVRVIKLSARKTDDYRLRVGDWRIEFTLTGKNVFVTEIKNRQVGY
jgi:mRNA-degrading endonuclease RelE of RelBE toxin-antitoxin system